MKDLLLSTLSEAVKGLTPGGRRADVINDIIENNDYQELSIKNADKVRNHLRTYNGMTSAVQQGLEALDFIITDGGKHHKLYYHELGKYEVTCSKTPSTQGAGKNIVHDIIDKVF